MNSAFYYKDKRGREVIYLPYNFIATILSRPTPHKLFYSVLFDPNELSNQDKDFRNEGPINLGCIGRVDFEDNHSLLELMRLKCFEGNLREAGLIAARISTDVIFFIEHKKRRG